MFQSRRALSLQLSGLVAVIALLALLSQFFPVIDLVKAVQQRVLQWGDWSAICYPLLFAACNLLLLPGGILCVGSGFFFGLWWGFLIVLVGNIIASAAAFAISRSVAHQWLRKKFAESARFRALEPAVAREGWKIIVLSQLHPLFPTSLITYLYGLSSIRFRTYMFWVTVGRIPGLFLYVYLGTLGQFGLNLAEGKTHPRALEYWVWGGAFLISAALLLILARIAVKTFDAAERTVTATATASATAQAKLKPKCNTQHI